MSKFLSLPETEGFQHGGGMGSPHHVHHQAQGHSAKQSPTVSSIGVATDLHTLEAHLTIIEEHDFITLLKKISSVTAKYGYLGTKQVSLIPYVLQVLCDSYSFTPGAYGVLSASGNLTAGSKLDASGTTGTGVGQSTQGQMNNLSSMFAVTKSDILFQAKIREAEAKANAQHTLATDKLLKQHAEYIEKLNKDHETDKTKLLHDMDEKLQAAEAARIEAETNLYKFTTTASDGSLALEAMRQAWGDSQRARLQEHTLYSARLATMAKTIQDLTSTNAEMQDKITLVQRVAEARHLGQLEHMRKVYAEAEKVLVSQRDALRAVVDGTSRHATAVFVPTTQQQQHVNTTPVAATPGPPHVESFANIPRVPSGHYSSGGGENNVLSKRQSRRGFRVRVMS
eukprot:PhF_6_TR14177/c0_g1_i2/m.22699